MPRTRPPLTLRRGTEAQITSAFAASPSDFEVGEPVYAVDTGRLFSKRADGSQVVIGFTGDYGTFALPSGTPSDFGTFP